VLAAVACGVHSAAECTDRIPCPDGQACSPDGVCLLVLPGDSAVEGADGRADVVPRVDGPPDAEPPDDGRIAADGASVDAAGIPDAGSSCAHELCELGGPLAPSCHPCAEIVCLFDGFCCTSAWDEFCVQETAFLCADGCESRCGDGICALDGSERCTSCPVDCGVCGECAHGLCEPGGPLDPSCDPCVETICAVDPYCCLAAWDDLCRGEVSTLCGLDCGGPGCGDGACAPSESCASCPTDCGPCAVCGDGGCAAGEGCTSCPTDCGPCPGACGDGFCATGESCASCSGDCGNACGACAHDVCMEGAALEDDCSPCVSSVCGVDPFCCSVEWDEVCVEEAAGACGTPCDRDCGDGGCRRGETCRTCPAECGACLCPHDVCEMGSPLAAACHPCAAAVCAEDAFCCFTSWDDRCVEGAETACMVSCSGG
jgi:hypothetical protein